MKTQFTLWQKVANTPPIALLVLFVWLLVPFNVSADVTAEWGDFASSVTHFPNTTYSTIYGDVDITITSDFANQSAWLGCNVIGGQHDCYWVSGNIDISLSEGVISGVSASVWDNGEGKSVQIQFCSSATYDSNYNLGDPFTFAWWGQYDANLSSVTSVPDGAKSARISSPNGGGWLYRLQVSASAGCASPATATFAKGDATSGSVEAIGKCAGNTFTMPGQGSMTYAGHKFTGWKLNNAGDLITAGTSYTMPAGGASFTAQWDAITVPVVTNASISALGSVVTLAYSIPGKLDLSTVSTNASYFYDSRTTPTSYSYNSDSEELSVTYSASQWDQKGVAFPIVLSNLETITFESKGHRVFPEAIYTSETKSYWENDPMATSDDWETSTMTINTIYFNQGSVSSVPNVDAITFCTNPNHNASNETFYIRNVFYHCTGQEDIDHVVIMRKAGQNNASTGLSDGTLLEPGTRSRFVDEEAKAGGWYTYTIFSVLADGTLSTGVPVNVEIEAAATYTVTYDIDGASGTTPTAAREYAATESFSLPTQGDLTKAGHKFAGWNDGSTTYAPGASYTMPAGNVTLTAVWNPFTVPAVTNLAVGDAVDKEVPLSWKIPGICDLSNPKTPLHNMDGANTTSKEYEPEGDDVKVTGTMNQYKQFGVAFDIPATTGIEWVSYDFKGTLGSGDHVWGGVDDGSYTYWHFVDPMLDSKIVTSSWQNSGQEYVNRGYWDATEILNNPLSQSCTQVAIYGNTAIGEGSSGTFYVRNVRYHIVDKEDIDHVVIVRKDGADPENPTDGTVLYNGTKSFYVDEDNSKEFGHTYHYAVFAVHADGTVSNPTITTHTVVATATCEVSFNIGEGTIGDAPTSVNKPANGTVTLPSIGTVYKPFYAFTGWKKNNAGDLLAAGSTYTVTAEDVTAETISFTAQWEEDNTTIRIPNTKTFGVSNKPANINTISDVDFNNDGNGDAALDIQNTAAEWSVFIQPGYYEVSMLSAVWRYGMKYTLSLIDPLTDTPVKTFFTKNISRSQNQTQYLNDTVGTFDLTDLIKGKRYVLKIEDTWTGCYLRVHDINFNPVTPEEIASEVVLDVGNTVTTGLTEVTDVDFPGDNDQSVNLYNKKMDWVVKIAKGYYNISLLYGAPEFSTRVSVALIDPEGVEPTRWFCPDQTDRNGHYYHTSGAAGTQYYSIGLDKRDLYDIDPEKTYIVRVHDENGSSNSLRVKDLTFTPIAPLNIPEVTRLNAANAVVSPGTKNVTIDGEGTVECLDIAGLKEAAWYAYIAPGIYDIKLTYAAATGGTKVRFGIIDIASGDTVFVKQENKYSASNTTYTISALSQNFTTIGGGVYKIIVKDNYTSNGVPSTGSVPQVAHLDIERTLLTHTRSGLRIGDYGTICLPYAVAAADRTGAELFEIESWAENGTSMTMTQLNPNETMEAGRPYIFQATANTATFSYYADGEEAEAGTHNGLIGSYVEAQIQENDNNYIIYNNKLYLVNAPARVGAYRAYIHRGGEYSPAPANRRRVTMGLYGTQTTTDINQISTEQITNKVIRNGHLFILRGDKIYNAQGQLVQ